MLRSKWDVRLRERITKPLPLLLQEERLFVVVEVRRSSSRQEPGTGILEYECAYAGFELGRVMVGEDRFELSTSWSQTTRANQLRYSPTTVV